MRSSLRKPLLLGAGAALSIFLTACGDSASEEPALDGRDRMSRPALAQLAPVPRQAADARGTIERPATANTYPAVAYALRAPGEWQPSWATAGPLPLTLQPHEEAWEPEVATYEEEPMPAPAPEPGFPGVILASLLEGFVGSSAPEAAAPPRRWGRGDRWRRDGSHRDRNQPRDRGDGHGGGGYGERPSHRPPPLGGARPDEPAAAEPPQQALPRAVPLVRVAAADLGLGIGPRADGQAIARVDRQEIRAAREAARREEEQRAASAQREAEGRAHQAEMQRQTEREAEAQRVREAEQNRLAARARAEAEAHRLAAAERQARAAREQAAQEARLREQRQALALSRTDPPLVQPAPQSAPVAQPAPIHGPAAPMAEREGRPQARGKPMAGAGLD